MIKEAGDTVHIPRTSNLTANTKTQGYSNTIEFEAITETKQDVTIATYQYAAFMVEDITETQSNINLRKKYANKLGYALSRGREVSLAALPQALSRYVGTLNQELIADDFRAGWLYLAQAGLLESSPNPGEDFSIFISPAVYADCLAIDEFISRDYNPNADAIGKAYIGDIYGFPVYLSNLLRSNGGGHDNIMMHKGCFALCVQREVGVKSQFMIEHIADAVVSWNIYGVAEMNYPPETPGGSTASDDRGVWLRGK